MGIAQTILAGAGLYLAAGALFALVFLAFGVARMDPAARGTHLGVRLVLAPGVILTWPLLLVRWILHRPDAGDHP